MEGRKNSISPHSEEAAAERREKNENHKKMVDG